MYPPIMFGVSMFVGRIYYCLFGWWLPAETPEEPEEETDESSKDSGD